MPALTLCSAFEKRLEVLLKKYPKSTSRIRRAIRTLEDDPAQENLYPGFGGLAVRKLRLGLPEYRIGKSNGIRLIHVFIAEKDMVVPLVVYMKKGYGNEKKVKEEILSALKEVLANLSSP